MDYSQIAHKACYTAKAEFKTSHMVHTAVVYYDAKEGFALCYFSSVLFFSFFSLFHTLLYNTYIWLPELQYALVLGLGCCWGLTSGIYDLETLKGHAQGQMVKVKVKF